MSNQLPDLEISKAYHFYKNYILDAATNKASIYAEYGFDIAGSVNPRDWEVFSAILLKDKAKGGQIGSDLQRHEVKSAIGKGSFEYQYHRNYGLQKLDEDQIVDHIFISSSRDYFNVDVWWVNKENLTEIFESWRPALIENYSGENPKLRYRRSVTYGFVRKLGIRLLQIENGVLIYPT